MAEQEHNSAGFKKNAQAALQSGRVEHVYKAIGMKLLELGVPDAETPDVADKVNHPLLMAYLHAQTQEARDRAWDGIAARISHLGSLLPPKAADGAFLADRVQVEKLLVKWDDFWLEKGMAELHEKRGEGLPRNGGGIEGTDLGLPPLDSATFKGRSPEDKSFWSGLYNGGHDPVRAPGWPLAERVADEQPTPKGIAENADVHALEQRSIPSTFGRGHIFIKQARALAQRVEILPAKYIVDLSGYRRDKELGDDPSDVILTGSNPKMPRVRVHLGLQWWIPNLVYSRLSRLVKLRVLHYSVAAHAPEEVEEDDFIVVCPYFPGWMPLEEWQEMPQDERVEITNPGTFSAHVALELLVDSVVDQDTFGYVLSNGTFFRDPSRHCFGPFEIGLAVSGYERGFLGSELDKPPPQMRWNDYRESIHEYNASPSAVAKLLSNLATLTDDDLISCVHLPDLPHRERVQSILLSRLLRIRKTARNYGKKVHELANKVASDRGEMAIEHGVSETERRQVHQGQNVQFLILSRRLAATRTLDVPYVVISITDSHDSYPDAEIAPSPLRHGILRLRFDDTSPNYTGTDYQPFSEAMAAQIVRFVNANVQSGVRGVIVHCAQGISRSSAVAACLSEWLNGATTNFFDDYFSPNARVREIMTRTITVMEPEGISGGTFHEE